MTYIVGSKVVVTYLPGNTRHYPTVPEHGRQYNIYMLQNYNAFYR